MIQNEEIFKDLTSLNGMQLRRKYLFPMLIRSPNAPTVRCNIKTLINLFERYGKSDFYLSKEIDAFQRKYLYFKDGRFHVHYRPFGPDEISEFDSFKDAMFLWLDLFLDKLGIHASDSKIYKKRRRKVFFYKLLNNYKKMHTDFVASNLFGSREKQIVSEDKLYEDLISLPQKDFSKKYMLPMSDKTLPIFVSDFTISGVIDRLKRDNKMHLFFTKAPTSPDEGSYFFTGKNGFEIMHCERGGITDWENFSDLEDALYVWFDEFNRIPKGAKDSSFAYESAKRYPQSGVL